MIYTRKFNSVYLCSNFCEVKSPIFSFIDVEPWTKSVEYSELRHIHLTRFQIPTHKISLCRKIPAQYIWPHANVLVCTLFVCNLFITALSDLMNSSKTHQHVFCRHTIGCYQDACHPMD